MANVAGSDADKNTSESESARSESALSDIGKKTSDSARSASD